MSREDALNNFIKTLTLLVKLNNQVGDNFFRNKLDIKITTWAYGFVEHITADKNNVSQYNLFFHKLLFTSDDLVEQIQDMVYLELLELSPFLLEVEKCLLLIKLDRMEENKLLSKGAKIKDKNETSVKNTVIPKVSDKPAKLNQSKLKILNFIKSYPDTRAKDIINEFSALSDRTVKRNLTELLKMRMIKKRVDNKATYYSHAEN
ncbi:MAG: hypothetical protein A3B86_00375 [Candidatus Yanofskybacteria bacterium RIFCSPHIGHO2_02_FULL_38_22b]|uniref:HTH deoR-type domain-containing protein n=1 Tax=Candidatus Yanofskybacteria bacterium RIFCSPHIGHO2_02_FULL_38_22b TaxID=1802673 RepID=A0A1F8F313_9BACT|nr:MAG: hypothetical protein A2816_02850 [Candidatus Yanofskybacteria bacterium RIFCSPHIGHO2_01_FULL_39_44]OGN06636.1 MAG: hypothetical protein A3B86_00375 [Candidatus Yanofskybacteria bacterium RIFCSPHIGHO2_02_FULL_38_22b]OGN20566.1 MAG: hypothetical protein A2910_01760 [Candidatus Yanofskybacteria bacterium RIFCSPLOWO2_01_FULL_39_28]